MVYKYSKITMPRMNLFQSNAFRLKNGAIYESIKLSYVSENGLVEKEITNYEYDTESRIVYLPDYEKENISVNRRVLVKYEIEVDCVRYSEGFTDGNFVSFQITKDRN